MEMAWYEFTKNNAASTEPKKIPGLYKTGDYVYIWVDKITIPL